MMKLLQQLLAGTLLASCLLVSAGNEASAQTIVQIGTATTYSNSYSPIAISSFGKNKHFQQLYTAAELNALGVTSASFIDSMAFNVYEAPNLPLPGYSIRMKNTNATSIATLDSIALNQAYFASTYTPVAGQWNWFHFQTPFFWDGVGNLLIDFCFDSTATTPVGSTGKVYFTQSLGGVTTSIFKSVTSQCSNYSGASAFSYRTNVKLSMRTAPACSGIPATPSITPGGAFSVCAGTPLTFNATGGSTGTGIGYTWQKSTDGGATWQTLNGVVGNIATFTAVDPTWYRVQQTCSNSGLSASSLSVQMNPTTTTSSFLYHTLPYTQDFEQWQNKCNSFDIPDSNWTNYPATGDASWRREDQGASALWTGSYVTPYYYAPVSSSGSHSARYHTDATSASGSISSYVNCSGVGPKELRFDYFSNAVTGTVANLGVFISTDGGASFTTLATFNTLGVNAQWQTQKLPFTSTAANTVIKFTGYGAPQSGDFDMGIDNLKVLPACADTPVAGTVDSHSACMGSGVQLSLTGGTAAAGLTWFWQQSTNGITWDSVAGGNQEVSTAALMQDTWFRCIVKCTVSGLSDTSAPHLLHLSPLYNCYCNSASTSASPKMNIGNVKLLNIAGNDTLINNGNPLPATNNINAKKHYTDYTNIGAANIIKDSSYQLNLTYMTFAGSNQVPTMASSFTKAYIDYNHNGVFDTYELVWQGSKGVGIYNTAGSFTVPDTALIGLTRMRIVTNYNGIPDSTVVNPCSPYSSGETEDYLVNVNNAPCSGNINAGTVTATDTSFCPGYPFTLTNANYDSISGFAHRIWQSSADGTTWNDITGTQGQNALNAVFNAAIWYRVKAVCEATTTNSYSNALKIHQDALCYCTSYADGGFSGMADSCDIGGFTTQNINHPLTGGHLNNVLAINKYTDYTRSGITTLYVDSTYSFTLDQTLLRDTHADAKVTMFIDWNGNGTYDVPTERVYSAIATSSSWHKTGTITIPSNAVLNKVTGMRLIVNNDTSANNPSDEACGIYTSGETEDYLLTFKKATVTPPNGIHNVNDTKGSITLYPNPSKGTVAIVYNGDPIRNASILVQNVTGQTLLQQEVKEIKDAQILPLDLSAFAKGIYFIKINSGEINHTAKVVLQ